MNKHKPIVLIVEDGKPLLSAWMKRFKQADMQVLPAENGAKAIDLAQKEHPDAVVVDLSVIDALSIIKKLREYKWGQYLPVTFINSWQESPDNKYDQDRHLAYNWSPEQVVMEVKRGLVAAAA